jgi:hypothetical protein
VDRNRNREIGCCGAYESGCTFDETEERQHERETEIVCRCWSGWSHRAVRVVESGMNYFAARSNCQTIGKLQPPEGNANGNVAGSNHFVAEKCSSSSPRDKWYGRIAGEPAAAVTAQEQQNCIAGAAKQRATASCESAPKWYCGTKWHLPNQRKGQPGQVEA